MNALSLRRFGQAWSVVSFVVPFALLGLVCASPVKLTQFIGPAAVVFLGIASIIPPWIILVQLGHGARIPVTLLLIVFAVLTSSLVDCQHNAGHRALPSTALPPLPTPKATGFADAVARWAAQVPHHEAHPPLIVIASEGGASRAGYWSADVLAALDELTASGPAQPGGFSRNVLAISSISGGSVGSVGWVAALRQTQSSDGQQRIARVFAGEDVLSPDLAGMLFPDLFQRFILMPVLPDRAEYIERGWEQAWRDACKVGCIDGDRDLMSRPFTDIWTGTHATGWLPMVFIGGASEEKGGRIVTGPYQIGATPGTAGFTDAVDFSTLAPQNIRASTAIHNGARFPWISPAGGVVDATGRLTQHVVDGGYFDASGAETARELLAEADDLTHHQYKLVLLNIRYLDRAPKKSCGWLLESRAGPSLGPPCAMRFASDVRAPLGALMGSRQGLQDHLGDDVARLRAALRGETEHLAQGSKLQVINIMLNDNAFAVPCDRDKKGTDARGKVCLVNVPLNWVLSKETQERIDSATTPTLKANKNVMALVDEITGGIGSAR